jgi:transaldolase/glucose-6-phosphate isomerase
MNSLVELWSHKQSFWFDYIRRDMMLNGQLKKMVKEDGLRGMTSNPTIFEKAIAAGAEYDNDLKKFAKQGLRTYDIFEKLAIKDIQSAADILKPVYQESKGSDGFVSLEVTPDLANDTNGTIEQAKRLFKAVGRANLMIKVPGTPAGIPAIEELTAAGININITLLFSVENYKQVMEAYVRGLERRVKKKLPIAKIASVASFFVSRVDSIIDKQLDAIIAAGGEKATHAKAVLNKVAIANAKLAYIHYESVISSKRWAALAAKNAQVQRLLWASTGTKDKRLSDVVYVEELIGPDTVNTMPPATIEAFRDHGRVIDKIKTDLDAAQSTIAALPSLGVDLEKSMKQLQVEGVKSFMVSFDSLLSVVASKRELLTGQKLKQATLQLGDYVEPVAETLSGLEKDNAIKRIWEKDATLWKNDDAHQRIIKNALGWLTVATTVKHDWARLQAITADVRKAKFTHVLLLGMGGSSLCPEVLSLTFGRKSGYPSFAILDSTEPASVLERASRAKPEKTLFIVASKSGSTTEPNAFFAYFYDLVKKKKGAKAGENFIAITDPGTQMENLAKQKNFRHIVLNPADIGGRYSALSYFGMLPAALMGVDVPALLEGAFDMAGACAPLVRASQNPGAVLGGALGTLANSGRNKLTFFLSKDIASVGTWLEQLIAESTGKEGKGILPVEAEPMLEASKYASDRIFVSIQTKPNLPLKKKLQALKKAGHPVIEIEIPGKNALGAEFFRWEFAIAVAGAVMGIDPFDQPNVQESKDLTKEYLEKYKSNGSLGAPDPVFENEQFAIYSNHPSIKGGDETELLASLAGSMQPGDYVALLAYIERNAGNDAVLQKVRQQILNSKQVATTIGYGPRFLHSTGQLHKGGSDQGVFIQITANDKKDAPIPDQRYGFSVLKEAQALGDLAALERRGRRAIRIHLKRGVSDLKSIGELLTSAFSAA